MSTIIKAKNICKQYSNGNVLALNDVSFDIEAGTIVAITGKSGSGKSTLCNIVGGLDEPTSGGIIISNTDISTMNEIKLSRFRAENIGFVFQFFNLIPEFTARENILFPLFVKKKKEDNEYYHKLISLLGIGEFINRIPSQLSGGEQQRVAIARALIHKPQLLLMDEPTGNLDEENRGKVFELIKQINAEFRTTILFVTHDKDMTTIADRVITLKDGAVICDEGNRK